MIVIELVLLIHVLMSSPHIRICQPSRSPSKSPITPAPSKSPITPQPSKNVRYYMYSLCLELIELVLLIYIPMSSPHVRICQPSSSPSKSPTVCIVLYETFLICSSYISHVTLPFPFSTTDRFARDTHTY